jgi:subtilisin family serine protease
MASWTVDALSWAQLSGARVSNWSFSMSSDDAVKDMLVETRNHGMVHFSSSGNSFPVPIAFPANFHAVHAIGSDGQKASGSQTGGTLAFAAPGVSIQTTDRLGVDGYNPALSPNGDYSIASGTSFASPYAAGVAALVLSIQPSLSAHDVWVALVASARELGTPGWDSSFGHGLLNARGALVVATEMAPGYAIVDPIAPDPPAAYGTIAAAVAAVPAGGLVLPIPTSYPEALVMKRPLLLRTWGTLPTVIGE